MMKKCHFLSNLSGYFYLQNIPGILQMQKACPDSFGVLKKSKSMVRQGRRKWLMGTRVISGCV